MSKIKATRARNQQRLANQTNPEHPASNPLLQYVYSHQKTTIDTIIRKLIRGDSNEFSIYVDKNRSIEEIKEIAGLITEILTERVMSIEFMNSYTPNQHDAHGLSFRDNKNYAAIDGDGDLETLTMRFAFEDVFKAAEYHRKQAEEAKKTGDPVTDIINKGPQPNRGGRSKNSS